MAGKLSGASAAQKSLKGADVIDIALSNLSRVLPVLEMSVAEYIEVSERTIALTTELES